MANKGLGKGFAALLADTQEDYGKFSYDQLGEDAEEIKNSVIEIKIDLIDANPDQPRKVFEPNALQELADSIKLHGVIMPIVLNKKGDRYMIIAGERRWRASKLAGKLTVPAIVKDYTDRQVKEISLIENLQREDLNPIEAANAMKQLMDEYDITQEELSERIGKSRSAVTNTLRLLTLDEVVIALVSSGALSAGHARALITLPKSEQINIAKKAVKDKLSVREVEQLVKKYYNPGSASKSQQQELSVELKDLIVRMQRTFGTKVSAIGNDKKGRIYIDYYSREDLDRISELLEKMNHKN